MVKQNCTFFTMCQMLETLVVEIFLWKQIELFKSSTSLLRDQEFTIKVIKRRSHKWLQRSYNGCKKVKTNEIIGWSFFQLYDKLIYPKHTVYISTRLTWFHGLNLGFIYFCCCPNCLKKYYSIQQWLKVT